jgi:glutathione S-transferase
LDTLSPVGKLIPSSGRERAEVKTWEALADGLLDASILARLEATWPGRKDSERSPAWIARQMGKIDDSLIAMDRALAERSNCVGIHLSLADIAVGAALDYLDFRFPNIDWRGRHPNLGALYERLAQRQSFIETVPV